MEFAVFIISFKNSILQLHMIDINVKQVREVFGFYIAVPTCDFLLAVTFYPQHGCWAVSGTGPDRTKLKCGTGPLRTVLSLVVSSDVMFEFQFELRQILNVFS